MMKDTSPAFPGKISALWLGIVALLVAMVVAPTRADVFSYAAQRRQIKACVLVMNTASGVGVNNNPRNAVPYLFYAMERRTDIKPGGWEFVNPLAPSTLTQTIRQRWQDRAFTTDPTLNLAQFRLNAPITKNLGAYWEVNLDNISIDDLQQFDIVYLAIKGNVNFTPDQREKLRRFADAGGTVWLEAIAGVTIGTNNGDSSFPVEVLFTVTGTGTKYIASPRHPLVTFPYSLSFGDAASLGGTITTPPSAHVLAFGNSSRGQSLIPVIAAGTGFRYLSAADFGAGHIVVSSTASGQAISGFAGGANVEGGNSGAVSGENFITAQPADLKLAYNIVAFASSVPTGSVNSRRTGGSREQIGNGLGRAWGTLPLGGAGTGSGVVVHKGVAFFVDGRNVLRAYDTNPANDLDGDRNPDDGVRDSAGAPYDEIWHTGTEQNPQQLAALGVRFGTPTIISAFTSGSVDLVAVTSTQGVTFAFPAFPTNPNGTLASGNAFVWRTTLTTASAGNLPNNAPALSSAVSEGILFTPYYDARVDVNNPWHILPIDPATGRNIFTGNTQYSDAVAPSATIPGIQGMSDPVGPVVVGSIRDQATNALDKVIYIPVRPTGNNQGSGSIQGVWFATKNEPLVQQGASAVYSPLGDRAKVPWFVPQVNVNPDLYPQIHVVTKDPATGRVTGTATYRYPSGAFTLSYAGAVNQRNMQVTMTSPLNANQTVYADYTLNWPGADMPNASAPVQPNSSEMARFSTARRYSAYSPDSNNIPAYIIGTPAISAQDTLLYNASLGIGDDRILSLREQVNVGAALTGKRGGSGSEMAWTFSPNGPGQYSLPNSQTVQVLPRLVNTDDFAGWFPAPLSATGQYVNNFRAIGSPAVVGNVTYVIGTASVIGSTQFNATIVLALNTNPSNTFSLGQVIPNDGTAVILRQIDPLRSNGNTTQFVRLTENENFILDRNSGTVTITNYRSAQDGDTFNSALPIYLTVGNNQGTEPIRDPKTGFGPLDNLIWYMIIPQASTFGNVTPASGPSVIGKVLHFGTTNGQIASIDIGDGVGGSQLPVSAKNSDGSASPRVQLQSIILDATGGTLAQPIIYPPVGTTNTVFASSPQGMAALDNRLTLIADNNRLIQVGYDGNAVWTADASRTLNAVGGQLGDTGQVSQTSTPFSRPSVARHYTLSTFMVADTGNNRILLTDKGGITQFELRQVANDMVYLRPNDPLTLNQPTDVQIITESGTFIKIFNRLTGATYIYTGVYTANHFFIADSGNNRMLEVIYAYDAFGSPITVNSDNPMKYPPATLNGQVIFATRSLTDQNANYRYRTVQQYLVPPFGTVPAQIFIAATVDNQRIASVDPATQTIGGQNNAGATGGSLVILKRDYANFTAANNKDGDTAVVINSIGYDTNDDGMADRRQVINNPTWFREFTLLVGVVRQVRYLLCDGNGCYVLKPSGSDLIVEWALSSDQYYNMTGRRLKAVSMQQLTTADYDPGSNRFYPRYLITNAFSGQDNVPEVFNVLPAVRGAVRGEVFEIRSLDYFNAGYGTVNGLYRASSTVPGLLEFNPRSAIVWMVPKEKLPFRNSAGNVSGPIIRAIGSQGNATATFLLEQPSSAERAN